MAPLPPSKAQRILGEVNQPKERRGREREKRERSLSGRVVPWRGFESRGKKLLDNVSSFERNKAARS